METLRLTKEELSEQYPDAEWRDGFLQAARLGLFLAKSILKEKYKIPDEIVGVIQLTEFGTESFKNW